MKKKVFGFLIFVLFFGFLYQPVWAKEIVFCWSGGASGENVWECYIKAFEKATGHKVIHDPGVSFAKLRAMVKSENVQYDLSELYGMDLYELGTKEGLFEPIDYNIVYKDKDCFEGTFLPNAVIFGYYSTVLSYDAEVFPKGKQPKNWKDFWDVKKFPGPRSLYKGPSNNLEFALMADGVPPDKLYPLDMDRAFRSLDKIKDHVRVWWTAGAQPAQLLTDKEVVMTSAWNGRIYNIIKAGAKVDIQWNQGLIMNSPIAIPKGGSNKKVAMELMNYFIKVENQACYAEKMGYPGPHKRLFEYVNPEFARYLITHPDNVKKMVWNNYKWWVENKAEAEERWNDWILK